MRIFSFVILRAIAPSVFDVSEMEKFGISKRKNTLRNQDLKIRRWLFIHDFNV